MRLRRNDERSSNRASNDTGRREISRGRAENLPPVVVIAASADGIAAISEVIRTLPRDFPAAVVVVQHRPAFGKSMLSDLLATRTQLSVSEAEAGQRLSTGRLYLAQPHQHLTISEQGLFRYVDGTRVRHLRSSANPLFESTARVFGPKAVAVVLTGTGMDGTDGVQAIKAFGGTVIAQDPTTVAHRGMPTAAIRTGAVDFVLPIEAIAPMLMRLFKPSTDQRP